MSTSEREAQRQRAITAIDEYHAEIVELARQIHSHPEIAYNEQFASQLLADALGRHDFEVEFPVGGVQTALRARKQGTSAGPTIAVLAEYDALPEIGHGCAHNLIAASGLAAAIALGPIMNKLNGTFEVLGTPAEEAGGGKIALIDAGIFADIDAAVMVHHAGTYSGSPTRYPAGTSLAVSDLRYEFTGKSAHAAHDPWEGANALNAVIKLFTGIDALRQHIKPEARIHGIITHGGSAPNVVPQYAAAEFYVRAGSQDYVQVLEEKLRKIAEGAALMTETSVAITRVSPTYFDERPSYVLGQHYTEHMRAMGMEVGDEVLERGPYSTDFGNVSYLMPAATGSFAISRTPIRGHSSEVVEAACSEYGYEQMLKVSKAMALTVLDLFAEPSFLADAQDEHTHWSERYEGQRA